MATTSASLLERLRRPHPADGDWRRLHDLYAPLVRRWLAATPGLAQDRDDLCQEVLSVLVREVPAFDRARCGSFRAWLRLVTVNRVRTWRRAEARRPALAADPTEAFLAQLEDPAGELARRWDLDHNRHVTGRLLALVRPDFAPATWAAFVALTLAQRPAAEVAAELGLSVDAVLQAKARVLRRLRQEAGVLLD